MKIPTNKRTKFILILILILAFISLFFLDIQKSRIFLEPQNTPREVEPPDSKPENNQDIQVILTKLNIPWEIVFLTKDSFLITERPGRVKLYSKNQLSNEYKLSEVFHIGEGGLLGAEKHPDFEHNQYLYFYLTYKKGTSILNKVDRYKLTNNKLQFNKTIIDNIPGAVFHDGGRIKFGPDNYLYITTGDAGNAQSAQDINRLSGKILRLTDEGSIPEDNPFNNAVFSYGHRNPQGLAWDSNKQLWIT